MPIVRAVVLAASIPLFTLAVGKAVAEDIITGTATYEVSLDSSKGTAVGGVSGRMIQSIRRNCDTYELSADLSADLAGANGAKLPLRMTSTAVEDERTLTFDVSAKFGPVVFERASGTATKNADGLTVVLTAPEAKTIDLKGDILFPVAIAQKLVRDARAGEHFGTYRVFDGGGHGMAAWSVSAVIGDPEHCSGIGRGDGVRLRTRPCRPETLADAAELLSGRRGDGRAATGLCGGRRRL